MLFLYLFILGTIIGSFLNVLILRYRPGETLFGRQLLGRSKCPKCRKILSWYELVPVLSFVLQRGRCRNCGVKLSSQYPIVELASGLILATAPAVFGYYSPYGYLWAVAFLLLLAITVIDIRHYVIPDSANIALGLTGLLNAWLLESGYAGAEDLVPGSFLKSYALVFNLFESPFLAHLVAGLSIAGFFTLIILLSRGRAMGWGDVKFGFALGLLFGWPDAIMALMIAYIIGAAVGISLIAKHRKTMKDMLPFGPFMALGGVIVFYFGYDIIAFYFRVLNIAIS